MIGIIVKTESEIEDLPKDWIPMEFNPLKLNQVFDSILGFIPTQQQFVYENGEVLIHFDVDSLNEPRAIIFNCVMSQANSEIIELLAIGLAARVFDSESCKFI